MANIMLFFLPTIRGTVGCVFFSLNAKKLGKQVFATFMGVSIRTLRYWEQGVREPNCSAKTLLFVAYKEPDALRKAFNME